MRADLPICCLGGCLALTLLLGSSAVAQLQEQWRLVLTNSFISNSAITSSGDLLITQTYMGTNLTSIAAMDSAGVIKWKILSTEVALRNFTLDSGENIYAVGSSNDSGTLVLIKMDSSGRELWRVFEDYVDDVVAIACDRLNNIGLARGFWPDQSYRVAKYDSNGQRLWSTNVIGPAAFGVRELEFDSGGNLLLYTSDDATSGSISILRKLSPDGVQLWSYQRDIYVYTGIEDLAVGADGTALLVTPDTGLTALDPAGIIKWHRTNVNSIVRVETNGDVLISEHGTRFYPVSHATTLTRLDAAGNVLWRSPVPGESIAFHSDNGNYVGLMMAQGYWGFPFHLAEVSPAGEQVWLGIYTNATHVMDRGSHDFLKASDGTYRLLGARTPQLQEAVIASLAPTPASGLPRIIHHPNSTNIIAGNTATFKIEAAGDPPLSFQWIRGNRPLTNETSKTLSLATRTPNDSADIFVEVSNAAGCVRSRVAELGVFYALRPEGEPYDVSVALNGKIDLQRYMYGTGLFTYRWFHNGMLLAGETNETLRIESAQLHHAAEYVQEVRNAVSLARSVWQVLVTPGIAMEWSRSQVSTQCCVTLKVVSAADGIYTATYGIPAGSIRKYDYGGALLWTKTNPAPAIMSAPGGGIVAAEVVRSGPYDSYPITRYAADGSFVWRTYGFVSAVNLDIISNHLVASGVELAFYTLDGGRLATREPACSGCFWHGGVMKLVHAPENTVIALGLVATTGNPAAGVELAVATMTADGRTIGIFRLGFSSDGYGIALTRDNDLIVATPPVTARFDRAGNRKWLVTNEVSGYVGLRGVALDRLGGPLVVLHSEIIKIIKYDSNGAKQWTRTSGRIGFPVETVMDLKANEAGEFYLLGGAANMQVVLEKIDRNGNTIWASSVGQWRQYSTGSLALDSEGRILVAVADGETETVMSFVEPPGLNSPVITSNPQPESTSTVIGSTVVLSAAATGAEPITYQWFRGSLSEPVTDGTNAQLILANSLAAQSGWYFLRVSNAHGFVFTRAVSVLIGPAPDFELWDGGRLQATTFARVNEGGSIRLRIREQYYHPGSFDTPRGWQWSFGGNPISGATNTFLVITNASLSDAGMYALTASNIYAAGSRSIRLVVEPVVQTVYSKRKGVWNGGYHPQDLRTPFLAANSASQLYVLATHPTKATWLLSKYRQNGTALWNRSFGPVASPAGLAVDATQNITAAGTTVDDVKASPVVVKYDPNGNVLWETRAPALRGSHRFTTGFAPNGAGEVFVTGSDYGVSPSGVFVAKVAANGSLLWTRLIPKSSNEWDYGFSSIAATPGGGVYVASQLGLARFNTAGQKLWMKGTNFGGVAVAPDGNVYATGAGGLTKYAASGESLWNVPTASGLIAADFGGVVVSHVDGISRFHPHGARWWTTPMAGFLALDSAGRVYISSISMGSSLSTRALDLQGQELWQAGSDSTRSFFNWGGGDVVVCPNGDVAVAHQDEDHYVIERYRPGLRPIPSAATVSAPMNPVRPGERVCLGAWEIEGHERLVWFHNGVEIPGVTNNILCLTADWDTDGSYEVAAISARRVFASYSGTLRLQRPFLYPPVKDANNQIRLRVLPFSSYGLFRIESSSDLQRWSAVTNVTGGMQPLSILLPNDAASARFFRAVAP